MELKCDGTQATARYTATSTCDNLINVIPSSASIPVVCFFVLLKQISNLDYTWGGQNDKTKQSEFSNLVEAEIRQMLNRL